MARTRPWWVGAVEAYVCPRCWAQPGDPCLTDTGRPRDMPHRARARDADRCPQCGSRVDPEGGPLCAHCQRVRDLIVEATTTWPRRRP